ncbi:maestro heat-like repeat family member 5 [Sphaerodactylus townsendi]|uniref:maestro heat-like repeat family member 5 n=1 Tax=Sphaerodactylus townsendi TaxID=933632 RepID=UPI0020272C51|nr:maestro heat-like repeat family member 5 [Sphaerodactylus townsendi]
MAARVSYKTNRIGAHPLREDERHEASQRPQQKGKMEAHKEELDENESKVCFCNLRNLREENSQSLVQASADNLCALAESKLAGVLRAICKYRQSIHKISPKHRLRINEVLQAVIRSARSIDCRLANVIIKLASEDMLRTTDLQDLYQDAAGDILVALWNHFPAEVLAKLLEGFQGRLLPYRSILCVLGKLANQAFSESDPSKLDVWERKLVEFVEKLLIDISDRACCEQLIQELMKGDKTDKNHALEKVFLYQYYGAILRTSDNSQLVQEHLCKILALSHRGATETKGIAFAVGLAASRHLDEVLKVLEDFSKTFPAQETSVTNTCQCFGWNTLLLCYGRVALGIKEEVLHRVELFLAKMIEYFKCNPMDMSLKKSFLIAVLMFLEAVAATGKAQGVRLHMKTALVECLIVLIEREPIDTLVNTVRQDAMYIVKELSELKPVLEAEVKSSLLCASFRSLFCLVPLDLLERKSCITKQAANVRGLYHQAMSSLEEMLQALLLENPHPRELKIMLELMEPWMTSALDHERERAVQTAMKLLKFVAESFHFDLSRQFSTLAHLTAVLIVLCGDPVGCVSSSAVQAVSCLYEVLLRRKSLKQRIHKRRKWSVKRSSKPQETDCLSLIVTDSRWLIAMHCEDQLFSVQLTNFLLSALESLKRSDPILLKAAEEVLNAVLQTHVMKIERVKDVVGSIYRCLQLRHSSYWTRKVVLKALTLMIPDHMEEVVQSCLSFSIPIERHASELWTAMAVGPQVATQVLHLLLKNLQAKETLDENSTRLSLAAMNVIYETFLIPGYRAALVEMHLQLFIPSLKQVLYVMQLDLPESLKARQAFILKETPGARSFQSTSVEIMKNLFSMAGDWEVYACIEFQQGWNVLCTPEQFLQGIHLIARAMAECGSSQIPGIFGEAALILSTEEDELKKMTALALVIEFLKSPSAVKMMNRFSLKEHLKEGLATANPVIRELCQKGLSNFVFQKGKVKFLRDQLPALINSVFGGLEENIIQGLKDIMVTIYDMDGQWIGPICVDLALNVRSFFEDERADVRASAVSLFGQLVLRAKEADKALLKKEVVYSLLALLLHLKDRDNTVAMRCKLTLLNCGLFLGWPHLKLMFRTMAWEDTWSCLVNVWKYLTRNNHDNIHIFISQALGYLHHPQIEIRHTAARFLGHTINYYSSQLSKNLDQDDIFYLTKVFQAMESNTDPTMANFAKMYRVILQKLTVKRRFAGAGERDAQVIDSSLGGKQLDEADDRESSPQLQLEGTPLLRRKEPLHVPTPARARRPFAQRGTHNMLPPCPARVAAAAGVSGKNAQPSEPGGHSTIEVPLGEGPFAKQLSQAFSKELAWVYIAGLATAQAELLDTLWEGLKEAIPQIQLLLQQFEM